MPKDLRIEFKVKNAFLYRALQDFAFKHELEGYAGRVLNVAEVSRYTGVAYQDIISYLTLRVNPWAIKSPRAEIRSYRLRGSALRLQIALGIPAEEIYPLDLYEADIPRDYAVEVDSMQMMSLAEARRQKLLPPPDEYEMDDPKPDFGLLYEAIKHLSPRQEKVIRMRFGLDGDPPQGLTQISKVLNCGKERIRQIEARALRLLRHPARTRTIKELWDA